MKNEVDDPGAGDDSGDITCRDSPTARKLDSGNLYGFVPIWAVSTLVAKVTNRTYPWIWVVMVCSLWGAQSRARVGERGRLHDSNTLPYFFSSRGRF